jgi:septum formation protein
MMALWSAGAPPLVLASQSRTRQDLLANAGIRFEAIPAAIDERAIEAQLAGSGAGASEIAVHLSLVKALKISAKMPGRLVVGADQMLCFEDRLFAKAADLAAARAQLELLSGKTHELHSGCCAVRGGQVLFETVSVARLSCRELSAAFIETYLARAFVSGSAGAYQIEGLGIQLFEAIEGDHFTVLGLPLLPLLKFLRSEGSLLS